MHTTPAAGPSILVVPAILLAVFFLACVVVARMTSNHWNRTVDYRIFYRIVLVIAAVVSTWLVYILAAALVVEAGLPLPLVILGVPAYLVLCFGHAYFWHRRWTATGPHVVDTHQYDMDQQVLHWDRAMNGKEPFQPTSFSDAEIKGPKQRR